VREENDDDPYVWRLVAVLGCEVSMHLPLGKSTTRQWCRHVAFGICVDSLLLRVWVGVCGVCVRACVCGMVCVGHMAVVVIDSQCLQVLVPASIVCSCVLRAVQMVACSTCRAAVIM
jgi:hypothetical protein